MMKRMILVIGIFALMLLVFISSGCINGDNDEKDENDDDQENDENGNKPPTANAGPDRQVAVGEVFSFQGNGSDVDGQVVSYEWDVDGDGVYDKFCSNCGMDSHMYDQPGTYQAILRVTDDDGATDTDVCIYTVI